MFKIMCYHRTHKPVQRYAAYILDVDLAKLNIATRFRLNTDFIETHMSVILSDMTKGLFSFEI